MPETSQWAHTASPFIAAGGSEAMYCTGVTLDGTPVVLYIERAISADHAFVTVAETACPADREAVFAAVQHAPQIPVPLSALAALGRHFEEVMRQELQQDH